MILAKDMVLTYGCCNDQLYPLIVEISKLEIIENQESIEIDSVTVEDFSCHDIYITGIIRSIQKHPRRSISIINAVRKNGVQVNVNINTQSNLCCLIPFETIFENGSRLIVIKDSDITQANAMLLENNYIFSCNVPKLSNSMLSIEDIKATNWISTIVPVVSTNDNDDQTATKRKKKRKRSPTLANKTRNRKKRKIQSKYSNEQFRDFKNKNKNVSWPCSFDMNCKFRDYIASDNYRMHTSFHLIRKIQNNVKNDKHINKPNENRSINFNNDNNNTNRNESEDTVNNTEKDNSNHSNTSNNNDNKISSNKNTADTVLSEKKNHNNIDDGDGQLAPSHYSYTIN